MWLALLLAANATSPRVLVAGTRFDELDDDARGVLVLAANDAFVAAGCTVRLSTCRDEACALREAELWHAGAVVIVSAARLGRDVSVAFKALGPRAKLLSRGDAMVDVRKVAAVTKELDAFALALEPQLPAPPPVLEPAKEPGEPGVEPVASPSRSYRGIGLAVGAVVLVVASAICFYFVAVDDRRLADSRIVGNDGIARWTLTEPQADGLRNAVRAEAALGGSLAALALLLAGISIAVW